MEKRDGKFVTIVFDGTERNIWIDTNVNEPHEQLEVKAFNKLSLSASSDIGFYIYKYKDNKKEVFLAS